MRLSIHQERTASLHFLSVLSKFSPFAHFYVNFSAFSREAAFSLTPCGFAGIITLRFEPSPSFEVVPKRVEKSSIFQ